MMLRTPATKKRRWSLEPTQEDALVQYDHPLSCEKPDFGDEDEMLCSYNCRNMVKSEVIENLERLETQAVQYEAALQALRTKLDTTEVENQRLVARVKSLEQSVAAATSQEQALRSQRVEEVQQAEERFRKHLIRCNELQEKLQTEIRLKSEAEATARAASAEVASLRDEMKNLVESSDREIFHLREENQRIQEENEYCVSKINAENIADRQETANLTEDITDLRMQYEALQERLNEALDGKREVEKELARVSMQLSTTRIIESQEAEAMIKSLRDELNYQAAEIAEAKKLKESHVKVEVLEEQLQTHKIRADRAEAKVADYEEMKLRISALEGDLKSWEDMISSIPGNLTRNDIPEKLWEMQREALFRLSENGKAVGKVKELEAAVEKALAEKQEAISAATLARQEAVEAQEKTSRLERQIAFLTRERDGLNSILASYDEEETFILQQQKAASGTAALVTPEKSKQKRIEELENLLANSQQAVTSLENELEAVLESSKLHKRNAETLASDLAVAHSKISALERESSQLGAEIGILQGKLACGEYNPTKTKVLKLRTSLEPTEAESPQTSSKLNRNVLENETHGTEQVAMMIENKQRIAMLTHKVGSLEQEISTLKKRENRYMQVFAEKAFTFRTACGLIFGYEILMNEKPDSAVTFFKLRSVYSRDKENETLEFQYTPDGHSAGRIDMLANDYTTSSEIERQVVTFLQGFKSIPAFMANLTLELFNRETIC